MNFFAVLCVLSMTCQAFAKRGKDDNDNKLPKRGHKDSNDNEQKPLVFDEETCNEISHDILDSLFKMVEDYDAEELEEFLCNSVEREMALLPVIQNPVGEIVAEYGEYAPCMEAIMQDFIDNLQNPGVKEHDLEFVFDKEACKAEVEHEVQTVKEMRRHLAARHLRGADRQLWLGSLLSSLPAIISGVVKGRRWLCGRWKIRWIC